MPTAITNPNATYVYIGGVVTLRSNYFTGKDITTSGPYQNYQFTGGNVINFALCPWNVNQPFTIIVHEQGCDDEVQLTFYAYPLQNNYLLNITPIDGQTYELRLMRNVTEAADGEISEEDANKIAVNADDALEGKSWTVEAYNAITARKAASVELKEPTYLLDTTGWESGLYLLRAIVGENVLVGKISVK